MKTLREKNIEEHNCLAQKSHRTASLRELHDVTGVLHDAHARPAVQAKHHSQWTGVRVAVGLVLAGLSLEAAAQVSSSTAEARDDEGSKVDTVRIEGARDKPWQDTSNVDLVRTEDDAQPYYIFDSIEIERSGVTKLEDLLRSRLPMNTAPTFRAQNSNDMLGNVSQFNLRGIGVDKTLILVNGRRMGGPVLYGTSYQPDINSIPIGAIERVEVLPNSSSGIYGGSALGGVINIVLKRSYSGSDMRLSYDTPFDGNGDVRTLALSTGRSFRDGKTNVSLSAQRVTGNDLLWKHRSDIMESNVRTVMSNQPLFYDGVPLGSTPNIKSADGSDLVLKDGTSLGAPMTHIAPGTSNLTSQANLYAGLIANAGSWDLNLPMTAQDRGGLARPLVKAPNTQSLMATVRHEFTPRLEGFAEFSYGKNVSRAPSSSFWWDYRVSADSPTNPFDQDVDVRWPNTYSALRETITITRNLATGLVARLPREWIAMLDYSASLGDFNNQNLGNVDSGAMDDALQNGEYNVFVDTMEYYQNLDKYSARNRPPATKSFVHDVNLRLFGPAFRLPGANMANVAVGLSYRKEGYKDATGLLDYTTNYQDSYYYTYYGKDQDVTGLYVELKTPFVTPNNEIPLVHFLELQLAMRADRYSVETGTSDRDFLYNRTPPEYYFTPASDARWKGSTSYDSTSPTIALKWQPVQTLTLRASYAEAFLPPTFSQMRPNVVPNDNLTTITDPLLQQTYSVQTISGGNPDLTPLGSESLGAGVIWQPDNEVLRGLRVSLDWYKITQNNVIGSLGAQFLLGDEATYSDRVTRDPATGRVTLINTSLLNLYQYVTKGWDVQVDYVRQTRWGNFGVSSLATLVDSEQRQLALDIPMVEYAGWVNEGGPIEFRGNMLLSWEKGPWYATWDMRYFSDYPIYGAPGSPYYRGNANATPYTFWLQAQGRDKISSQLYHDLMVQRQFGGAGILSNSTVQLGIKNVFDKVPPYDAYHDNGLYTGFADMRMRSLYVSMHKRF